MPTHKFTLHSTGHSSSRYGACELCKLHCAEVFIQATFEAFPGDVADGEDAVQWAHRGHQFGHEACLLAVQKDPASSDSSTSDPIGGP